MGVATVRDEGGSHGVVIRGVKEEVDGREEGRSGALQHILISHSPEFSNSLWKFKGERRVENNLRGTARN